VKVRKLKVTCLCLILSTVIMGCTETKDTSTKERVPKEENKVDEAKENSNSKVNTAPNIDENCAEVYSKEECEQFAAYTQSNPGKQKAQTSKEKPMQKEEKFTAREVYEKMYWVLEQWGGGKIYPAPFEKALVTKRQDGLYYINSTYEIRGTLHGDGVYPYEMLVSDTFELKDAYMPGTYGKYDRPMQYDAINEYNRKAAEQEAIRKAQETPEDRERKLKEEEEKKKKRKEVMESIYGKDAVEGKEIDMDKKIFDE
jgi:hypothetical protein